METSRSKGENKTKRKKWLKCVNQTFRASPLLLFPLATLLSDERSPWTISLERALISQIWYLSAFLLKFLSFFWSLMITGLLWEQYHFAILFFLRLKKFSLESNYRKICLLICRILGCHLIIYIFVCSIIALFRVLGISISYIINHISYSFNIFYTHIIAQYMSFLSRLFLLG